MIFVWAPLAKQRTYLESEPFSPCSSPGAVAATTLAGTPCPAWVKAKLVARWSATAEMLPKITAPLHGSPFPSQAVTIEFT